MRLGLQLKCWFEKVEQADAYHPTSPPSPPFHRSHNLPIAQAYRRSQLNKSKVSKEPGIVVGVGDNLRTALARAEEVAGEYVPSRTPGKTRAGIAVVPPKIGDTAECAHTQTYALDSFGEARTLHDFPFSVQVEGWHVIGFAGGQAAS